MYWTNEADDVKCPLAMTDFAQLAIYFYKLFDKSVLLY